MAAISIAAGAAAARENAPKGPQTIATYEALRSALIAGHDVKGVVTFNLCSLPGGAGTGPLVAGGFRIVDFLVVNDQYIAFSVVHETLNARNEMVTEFIRYRATPDDRVLVRTVTAQARDGSLGNQAEYTCAMEAGAHFIDLGRAP
jgi:hypothetical protein